MVKEITMEQWIGSLQAYIQGKAKGDDKPHKQALQTKLSTQEKRGNH